VGGESCGVARVEAEAILDGDRETAIGLLLRLDDLVEANQRLVEANERLEARVAELERRLSRSSRNSSLPPSQDPPSAPPRPRGEGSGRKRGGQHGHEGRYRRLLPPERVDEIVEHWPERCRSCAHVFSEPECVDAAEPSRRQVAELPPIAVSVTEHRLHRVCCPACATVTAAEPPAVSRWAFGPRLQAAVVALAVRNRVSRRDTTELARELFGVELSTGTVDAIFQRTGDALAGPYTELERRIKTAAAVNVDETGWRLRGGRRTLWGAFTEKEALLRIAPDRHERELVALLGEEIAGIASSDRWWAYNRLDPTRRQVCWSHLVRDFTAHSEGMAAQKELGETGLRIADQLFAAWRIFKCDGDRRALKRRVAPLKRELQTLLNTNATTHARNRYTRTIANNLLKLWPALWTFTEHDRVEPTNNHAERGLRGAVIYRKLSFGSQSEHGERAIERLLSASHTCRLQHRSLFAYLTDVSTANIRGDPIPALT
jgi:transposase